MPREFPYTLYTVLSQYIVLLAEYVIIFTGNLREAVTDTSLLILSHPHILIKVALLSVCS